MLPSKTLVRIRIQGEGSIDIPLGFSAIAQVWKHLAASPRFQCGEPCCGDRTARLGFQAKMKGKASSHDKDTIMKRTSRRLKRDGGGSQ